MPQRDRFVLTEEPKRFIHPSLEKTTEEANLERPSESCASPVTPPRQKGRGLGFRGEPWVGVRPSWRAESGTSWSSDCSDQGGGKGGAERAGFLGGSKVLCGKTFYV